MKVKVVSDLHLETLEHAIGDEGLPDLGTGDILILGGDILCVRHFKTQGKLHQTYLRFLKRCADNYKKVLYISGNHEAYGYNYEGTFNVIRNICEDCNIHFLENDTLKIEDWVFIGFTLWTDFRNENALEMMEASQCMNDYKIIRITSKYRKMTPEDTLTFHKESKKYLLNQLEQYKNDKIWVLSHHAPSHQSVHPKYRSSGIANGAFVSDLDDLILNHSQIKYWSHGHTHESFDYHIGNCRIICNPRGYYNGYNNAHLNLNFNPDLEIEI